MLAARRQDKRRGRRALKLIIGAVIADHQLLLGECCSVSVLSLWFVASVALVHDDDDVELEGQKSWTLIGAARRAGSGSGRKEGTAAKSEIGDSAAWRKAPNKIGFLPGDSRRMHPASACTQP
jgi:hypothetical protein